MIRQCPGFSYEESRARVFSMLFTGRGKILARLRRPCAARPKRENCRSGGRTGDEIAQSPPVHVNFAGEPAGLSPNRQDNADT